MPKAEKVIDVRNSFSDGAILVIRVWRLAEPVPPARHRFNYSLFYGRPGERLVLFDNERGKGDHKHIREAETDYGFEGIAKLMADFLAAVRAIRAEESE